MIPIKPILALARKEADLIGATTGEERGFCEYYAAELFKGDGLIVELGSWMGSLTRHLLYGLEQNSFVPAERKKKVIQTYDLFRWEPYMDEWVKGTQHEGKLQVGSNFCDYFSKFHGKWASYFDAITADLGNYQWDGRPIEHLVNDAAKSASIAQNISTQFLPSVILGGLVSHQDFLWATASFIQLHMFLLRDSFKMVLDVPDACMVVFEKTAEVTPAQLATLPADRKDYALDLITETFAWSRLLLPDTDPRFIDLGEACILEQAGHIEEGKRIVRDQNLLKDLKPGRYKFMTGTVRNWGYKVLD